MTNAHAHRHGRRVHSHGYVGPHRHLLWPFRSEPSDDAGHDHAARGHSHGLIDPSIKRSRAGVRAVLVALAVLGVTAALQALVFMASGSVALLADLVHNAGDAATAIPLGIAFALRSSRGERWAGYAVVLAILASACVAGYEAISRLIDPREVDALVPLALAGGAGFAGNWVAAIIRSRAGAGWTAPR
jgi:divalent metal cation (Fe/Co/Zn/Cd) transporter